VDIEADRFHLLFHEIGNFFLVSGTRDGRTGSGTRLVIYDSDREMLDFVASAIRV
jgi:hypothetical protein